MPPRHGKTEQVTVRYGAYSIERRPEDNVLVTGYNERIARRFSRKTRNIVQARTGLAGDKKATDEWAMPQGGTFMARGVGSPPTGVGFRRIIIDDPIRRREDADSETYREKVWDWYTDDLYTRLEPSGALILVMTRWHEDDLWARAKDSEPGRWVELNLEAIAETMPDALGREAGQALWPDRYDTDALARIRMVLEANEGARSWYSLYQGKPFPASGDFFNVEKLGYIDAEPVGEHIRPCRAWDLAGTEGAGDYTAGVKVARNTQTDEIIVCDARRGQWGPDKADDNLKATAEEDGKACPIYGRIDPGGAGKRDALHVARLLIGFRLTTEHVTGPKAANARGFASQVNAGNVKLVRGDWNKAFIAELRAFPSGKYDDQVDAGSDAFNVIAKAKKKQRNLEAV